MTSVLVENYLGRENELVDGVGWMYFEKKTYELLHHKYTRLLVDCQVFSPLQERQRFADDKIGTGYQYGCIVPSRFYSVPYSTGYTSNILR